MRYFRLLYLFCICCSVTLASGPETVNISEENAGVTVDAAVKILRENVEAIVNICIQLLAVSSLK